MQFTSRMMQQRQMKYATAALAVWLLIQTSTLYFLHHHPESAFCEETATFYAVHSTGVSTDGSTQSTSWVGPQNRSSRDVQMRTAVCVICFLNQNNHGFPLNYVIPDGSQVASADGRSIQDDPFLRRDRLTNTTPRAPPTSCL